jgi:hypothetical protein
MAERMRASLVKRISYLVFGKRRPETSDERHFTNDDVEDG